MSSTIGELSTSTGVPIATLRDWDRRHGVSPSHRTIGGHRRYTESDARMVTRVRDLVAGGRRLKASVAQARADHLSEHGRPPGTSAEAAHAAAAATEHHSLRESLSAARAVALTRRDELVADRVALVARREALVKQRPTLTDLADALAKTSSD